MTTGRMPFSRKVFAAVTLCLQGMGSQACGGIATDGAPDGDPSNDDLDQNEPDVTCRAADCPPHEPEPPVVNPPPVMNPPPDVQPPDIETPDDDPPELVDPPLVDPPQVAVCEGSETVFTEGLNLPAEPEFLGVVRMNGDEAVFEEARGTCLGSSDTAGCIETIQGDDLMNVVPLFDERYLVAVSFDVMTIINDVDSLVRFLGPIDTATETELVLRARGYNESNVGSRFVCGAFSAYEQNCLIIADDYPYVPGGNNCAHAEGTRTLLCVDAGGGAFETEDHYTVYGECLGGRRPAGLLPFAPLRATKSSKVVQGDECALNSSRAAYFVRLYQLESAAVVAFSHLALELEEHGAPARLAQGARDAAQDEVRHAYLACERATQWGARLPLPKIQVAKRKPRSLLEMALENAEEGYVRESFGAAQALLRAKRATEPADQSFWSEIAADELRHAEFSRDLGEWLKTRLTAAQNKQVSRARAHAYDTLHGELKQAAAPASATSEGPSPALQLALLERLRGELAPRS